MPRFRIQEQKSYDLFQKGLLFYHSQHYSASREFFYKALNIHPYFYLARRYLGDAHYYSGNWSEAIEQWESLNQNSNQAYPLVQQRSELLRFSLGHVKKATPYVFLRDYHPKTWPMYPFRLPTDIAISDNGEIYLLSLDSANIIRFTPTNSKIDAFSGPFYDPLSSPLGLTISSERKIYVYDYKEDRVRVFNHKGNQLFSFGKTGLQVGQFHGPTGIAVNKDFIFVSDSGNRRIQKFDLTGKFLLAIGRNPKFQNQPPLSHPAGLALGSASGMNRKNVLYVADRDSSNILKFDFNGNFLGNIYSQHLKKPRGLHIHDKKLVIADEESGVLFYDIAKNHWSRLNALRDNQDRPIHIIRPFAARLDSNGSLYVVDYGANRLLALIPQGMRISNFHCKIQRIDINSFPQVALFASVKSRFEKPLTNLGHGSFSLFENDVSIKPIKTDNMIPYNRRITLAIVKESSPFFAQNYDRYLRQGIYQILKTIRISDQIYLLRASQDSYLAYEGLERRRLLRLMQSGKTSPNPNLGKTVYTAITKLLQRSGPRVVLFLVSGKYHPNAFHNYDVHLISQYAQAHDIPIHVISYQGERDLQLKKQSQRLYQSLAKQTNGSYIHAFDRNAWTKLKEVMANTKDHRYIITYKTNLGPRFKGRYVDLRLEAKYQGAKGLADAGYFVP